jgi:succinate dehydrogenase / fumarate reductase cytochrome b subunit
MADAIKAIKKRPGEMRLIDATQYRLPPAGWVSILHRVSGLLLIVLMPFVLWMFDVSLKDEVVFMRIHDAFVGGFPYVPSFVVKIATLVLIWAFLQHFCAGVRHLYMDFTHSVTKEFGRVSALVAMGVAGLLTLVFAYKLFIGY